MTQKIMLKTTRDKTLDGYIFQDQDHTIQWPSQRLNRDHIEEYKVAICTVTEKERRCKHCNQRDIDIHVKATMDAEDFLSLGPLEGVP